MLRQNWKHRWKKLKTRPNMPPNHTKFHATAAEDMPKASPVESWSKWMASCHCKDCWQAWIAAPRLTYFFIFFHICIFYAHQDLWFGRFWKVNVFKVIQEHERKELELTQKDAKSREVLKHRELKLQVPSQVVFHPFCPCLFWTHQDLLWPMTCPSGKMRWSLDPWHRASVAGRRVRVPQLTARKLLSLEFSGEKWRELPEPRDPWNDMINLGKVWCQQSLCNHLTKQCSSTLYTLVSLTCCVMNDAMPNIEAWSKKRLAPLIQPFTGHLHQSFQTHLRGLLNHSQLQGSRKQKSLNWKWRPQHQRNQQILMISGFSGSESLKDTTGLTVKTTKTRWWIHPGSTKTYENCIPVTLARSSSELMELWMKMLYSLTILAHFKS